MYSLNKKFKMKKKYKYQDEKQLRDLDGFMMPSKRKSGFMICGENISNIMVISYDMAAPLVRSYVSVKYKKLISFLTELLVTDDDNGDSYREALNQIEKMKYVEDLNEEGYEDIIMYGMAFYRKDCIIKKNLSSK